MSDSVAQLVRAPMICALVVPDAQRVKQLRERMVTVGEKIFCGTCFDFVADVLRR